MQNNQSPYINPIPEQKVVPPWMAPVQYMYLSDQNPRQYEAQVAAIVCNVNGRVMYGLGNKELTIREFEWVLINELTKLKTVYTRYFFSVTRREDKIDVELYDPMGQLEHTVYSVCLDANTLRFNELVNRISQRTNQDGTAILSLIGNLQEVPLYYLAALINQDIVSTCGLINTYPDVFCATTKIQPDQPTTMISIQFPQQYKRRDILSIQFINDAATNTLPRAVQTFLKEDLAFTHVLGSVIISMVHGVPNNHEMLNCEQGRDYLTRIGVWDKENNTHTKFFQNMLDLLRRGPQVYTK